MYKACVFHSSHLIKHSFINSFFVNIKFIFHSITYLFIHLFMYSVMYSFILTINFSYVFIHLSIN